MPAHPRIHRHSERYGDPHDQKRKTGNQDNGRCPSSAPRGTDQMEIANELGYFDKIVASGWKSLTSRENGRIGGVLSARAKKKESVNSTKNEPEHGK